MALFNLHDFSVTDSCEAALTGERNSSVVPIRVIDTRDGGIEKLNKTVTEKKLEEEEKARKEAEQKASKKKRKKKAEPVVEDDDTDINIF